MPKTTFQFLWKESRLKPHFRAGVSLHSHTLFSEESLIPASQHLFAIPCLGPRIRADAGFDFTQAYWTPPLSALRAYRLEEKQIHRSFQLSALVSLTDHDDIRAGTLLRVLDRFREAPISTEWTLPFESTFFHLGIHNIPASCAQEIAEELTCPHPESDGAHFARILALLNSFPDVLIVLNHPLWDEKGLGPVPHFQILRRLLERHGKSIHALEVNGLRPWHENRRVMRLGGEAGMPVVSGGDRHGLEANSILNLSPASTFTEFVHEVRYSGRGHVVFMPQYRDPYKIRILRMIADVLREYPDMPGRETWADRVYVRQAMSGGAVPVSSFLNASSPFPRVINALGSVLQASKWHGIRWALALAWRGGRPTM